MTGRCLRIIAFHHLKRQRLQVLSPLHVPEASLRLQCWLPHPPQLHNLGAGQRAATSLGLPSWAGLDQTGQLPWKRFHAGAERGYENG